MKMLNLSITFAFAFMLAAFLSAGCSTDVAGTAEEPNEFKELAEIESSSSTDEELPASSSAIQSSSSTFVSSSSENKDGSAPVAKPDTNSLNYYLLQYGITDVAFDSKVFASTTTYKENTSAPPQSSTSPGNDGDTKPGSVASATEFDGQGFHPFVKQNIDALKYFFPEAYEKFTKLINDIKNDSLQNGCGLYMLNIYASSQYAGQVLTEITSNSVTVFDIQADACLTGARADYTRFLVSYCGELDNNPEIVRKTVEVDIPKDKCPQVSGQEWVK